MGLQCSVGDKKIDGTLRCCIDYRKLNAVKDVYPLLPRINDCLDAMASAKLFSSLDMRSSYNQVAVAPQDRDKTAFICPRGMYRYKTMPFGLCNAGASFERLVDILFSGLHLDVCLVYVDDIVVFSTTVEEHFERLVRVFARLREAKLKLKPSKCLLKIAVFSWPCSFRRRHCYRPREDKVGIRVASPHFSQGSEILSRINWILQTFC